MTPRLIGGWQQRVRISDPSGAGECRRSAKQLAERHGFNEASVGRICIIATEVATNILHHAGAGCVLIQVLDDGVRPEFEILGIDRGPGMMDVDRCMRDGYSTSGTSGTGLGAVSRLSATFDLFSTPDKGTVVLSRTAGEARTAGEPRTDGAAHTPGGAHTPGESHTIGGAHTSGESHTSGARAATRGFELGAISLAVAGETECGDTWRAADDGTTISILVADGLGHGPSAAAAANAAAAAFESNPFESPAVAMTALHGKLSGSRGAAAACARLRVADRKIDFAGVGNICGTIVTGERSHGMVSHNGTLGVQLLRTQQFEYAWPAGSHVVMHSDGLSGRWNARDYPGLLHHHPAVIAGTLLRDFERGRDDATVVVAALRS